MYVGFANLWCTHIRPTPFLDAVLPLREGGGGGGGEGG